MMDNVDTHKVTNSLLECSICFQVFQNPRMLPCGHTFCLQCIQQTNGRLCPLCKKEWSLPANGLQGLPKNFIAESFIKYFPSVSQCAVAGNSSHGLVEYFCTDCWDPLCQKCGQRHTQYSRTTKHHVIKKLNEVDQSDIELHNRQKALKCVVHKDEIIKFQCISCDEFICSTCYVLFHNKHECISTEDADKKLLALLNDLTKNVQEGINKSEEKLRTVKLSKDTLEDSKSKLLETVRTLISDIKTKMQVEYDKLVNKVDECYKNVIKQIVEKTDEEKKNIEQLIKKTQTRLQSLQEAMSHFKRHMSSMSTPVERTKFLKSDSLKKLTSKLQVSSYYPTHRLPDISQWRVDINAWLQSLIKALSNQNDLPQMGKDVTIISKPRLV